MYLRIFEYVFKTIKMCEIPDFHSKSRLSKISFSRFQTRFFLTVLIKRDFQNVQRAYISSR